MKTSFIKCLEVCIRELGQKRWCYIVIIERGVCSWKFCVMRAIWGRVTIFSVQFFYIDFFRLILRLMVHSFHKIGVWILDFFTDIPLNIPGTTLGRKFKRAIKLLKIFTLTFVSISIKVNQWPILMLSEKSIHELQKLVSLCFHEVYT